MLLVYCYAHVTSQRIESMIDYLLTMSWLYQSTLAQHSCADAGMDNLTVERTCQSSSLHFTRFKILITSYGLCPFLGLDHVFLSATASPRALTHILEVLKLMPYYIGYVYAEFRQTCIPLTSLD